MNRAKENPASRETDGDSLEKLFKINDGTILAGLSDGMQAGFVFCSEAWRDQARATALSLAQAGVPFTVDDLRRGGVDEPDRPQRWGSIFATMKNQGLISLHSLTLHQIRQGDTQSIRVWVGTKDAGGQPL